MNIVENQSFDEERAFYGSKNLLLRNSKIDGAADGESAFKECEDIEIDNCCFNLRYPFWHNDRLKIANSSMTENCRAALWYSNNINIENTKMHGIKAVRECSDVMIINSDIVSPEFGWFTKNIVMKNTTANSEYFMMRSENIKFNDVDFKGKYSFQYIKNATFENCIFDTKDAFWHGENIVVKNSVVKGEYLAWYSKNLTFENCRIIGTQPLCYCTGLKLINCEMIDTDLCFEKSEVEATITTPVISIKNVKEGRIYAPAVGEIICDDKSYKGEVVLTKSGVAC